MRKYNAFTMMELSVSLVIIAILLAVMTTVFVQKSKIKSKTSVAGQECFWQKTSGTHIWTQHPLVIGVDSASIDALLTVDKDSDSFKMFYPLNWGDKSFPGSLFNNSLTHYNGSNYAMLQNQDGSLVFQIDSNPSNDALTSTKDNNISLLSANLTTADIERTVTIGKNSKVTNSNAVAIGTNAEASGEYSVVIGNSAKGQFSIGSGNTNQPGLFKFGYAQTTDDDETNWGLVINNTNKAIYLNPRIGGVLVGLAKGNDIIGSENATLNVSGTVYYQTANDTSSDKSVKNIKSKFKAGLDKLNKITPYTFTFKDDESKRIRTGVIAQDLQKVFPNSVIKSEKTKFLSVNTDEMLYAMVNAVKEVHKKMIAFRESVVVLVDNLTIKIKSLDKSIADIMADKSVKDSLDDLDSKLHNLNYGKLN